MDRRSLALASRHRHPPGPARPYEVASLGLRSIVAYTRSDNVASRGVMSKLAMTYEKSFDFDGKPHVLYRKPLAKS